MNGNTPAFCASRYDEEIRKVLPYYEDFYKQVVDIVNVRFNRPLTWLDIGCGTGKMAEAAFKSLDIENFLFCDSSEDMIKIAKERFAGEKSKYVVSSFPELNESGPFDVITAMMVFHYFTKEVRKKALQKCYKNLRNNGIFITFENFAPYSEAGKQLLLARWKSYQLSQGRRIIEFPVPVLKASCDTIKAVRERLYRPEFQELTVVDFSGLAQGCRTYDEFIQKMGQASEETLQKMLEQKGRR